MKLLHVSLKCLTAKIAFDCIYFDKSLQVKFGKYHMRVKEMDSSGEAICPPNLGHLGGPSGHPGVPGSVKIMELDGRKSVMDGKATDMAASGGACFKRLGSVGSEDSEDV